MPIVSRTLIAGDYLMALVKSGSVKILSAYLPNDALVTMHNLRNFHGKEKKGVGFDADLSLADGDWPPDLVPASDGQVRDQKVHLCSKDCKSKGKSVSLGGFQWYLAKKGANCKSTCESIAKKCVNLVKVNWIEKSCDPKQAVCPNFFPGLPCVSDGDGPRVTYNGNTPVQCKRRNWNYSGMTCTYSAGGNTAHMCACK